MNHSDQRPIVCGTDFSTHALEAANVAAAMAMRLGAPLLLVHGADERGDIPATYWPSIQETQRPQLETEATRLRARGTNVEEHLTGGVPDEGVADCAERADARLIVLAASGQGAFGRWLLGSVSERIAETAWVPTLVVRRGERMLDWAHGGKPLRVFVGTDFTRESDAALAWTAQLREVGPCEFTIGFVDRLAEKRAEEARELPRGTDLPDAQEMFKFELEQRVTSFLPQHDVHVRVLPTSGHVESHLLEMAAEARADLIVVGTHQWRGLSRLRHPSVSRRLLHTAHGNVVCVPARHVVSARSPCVAQARQVIVATDLSPHGGTAIPYAFSMMQLGGTAWLLHVAKSQEGHEEQLRRLQELIPTEPEQLGFKVGVRVVVGEDVAATICEVADQFQADLICVGSRGPDGKAGAVAHAVINRSRHPVLIVPQTLS
jgi:nucleotide-binding universal stress UspA family protein